MKYYVLILALLLCGCESNIKDPPETSRALPPLPQAFMRSPGIVSNSPPPRPAVVIPLILEWTNLNCRVDVLESTNLSDWRKIASSTNTQLQVTNSGTAGFFRVLVTAPGNVMLAWDPSPSAGVAGYNVYQGGVSRIYTNTLEATGTNIVFTNIQTSSIYYFAATAFNSNGLESVYSDECCYTSPPSWEVPRKLLPANNLSP